MRKINTLNTEGTALEKLWKIVYFFKGSPMEMTLEFREFTSTGKQRD